MLIFSIRQMFMYLFLNHNTNVYWLLYSGKNCFRVNPLKYFWFHFKPIRLKTNGATIFFGNQWFMSYA